jgi:mono/diheme cytochrome c family protein
MKSLCVTALLVFALQAHAAPDAGAAKAEKKTDKKADKKPDAGAPAAVATADAGQPAAKDTKDAGVKPAAAAADAGTAKAAAPATGGGKYTLVAIATPDKKVERVWKSKCGSCHGVDGKAATAKGKKMKMADMSVAAWQTGRGNDELKKAIVDGVKLTKDGVEQEMDAYGKELSAEQVDEFVTYVRWLGSPR